MFVQKMNRLDPMEREKEIIKIEVQIQLFFSPKSLVL